MRQVIECFIASLAVASPELRYLAQQQGASQAKRQTEDAMKSGARLSTVAMMALLATAGCAQASRHSQASAEEAQPATVDIQGAGEWKRSPHMRAYYDATVATFANGTDIDVDAYEARSFAIFREFARANGGSEEAMIEHLKLIPRQVVGIVKEDPDVLKSYDAFWAALSGPE
jgi:hypothetical protein